MLSRLDKFINNPRRFFSDAFKKREARFFNKLSSANHYLNKVGIKIQLDEKTIEHKFVNIAVKLFHDNKVSYKIVGLIKMDRQYNKIECSKLSNLEMMQHRFKHLLEIFNHLLANSSKEAKYLNWEDPLNDLSTEAQAIYLQLVCKIRDARDN